MGGLHWKARIELLQKVLQEQNINTDEDNKNEPLSLTPNVLKGLQRKDIITDEKYLSLTRFQTRTNYMMYSDIEDTIKQIFQEKTLIEARNKRG